MCDYESYLTQGLGNITLPSDLTPPLPCQIWPCCLPPPHPTPFMLGLQPPPTRLLQVPPRPLVWVMQYLMMSPCDVTTGLFIDGMLYRPPNTQMGVFYVTKPH